MTRRWFSGRRIRGLSSDSKPTLVEDNQEFTETDTGKIFDWGGSSWSERKSSLSVSATTQALDFSTDELQTDTITANTTFTSSNRVAGRSKTIKLTGSGTHNLYFQNVWRFVGAKPTDLTSGKVAILTLTCFGSAESDIVCAYAVEE